MNLEYEYHCCNNNQLSEDRQEVNHLRQGGEIRLNTLSTPLVITKNTGEIRIANTDHISAPMKRRNIRLGHGDYTHLSKSPKKLISPLHSVKDVGNIPKGETSSRTGSDPLKADLICE